MVVKNRFTSRSAVAVPLFLMLCLVQYSVLARLIKGGRHDPGYAIGQG
jgi:hypothetical protein